MLIFKKFTAIWISGANAVLCTSVTRCTYHIFPHWITKLDTRQCLWILLVEILNFVFNPFTLTEIQCQTCDARAHAVFLISYSIDFIFWFHFLNMACHDLIVLCRECSGKIHILIYYYILYIILKKISIKYIIFESPKGWWLG